MKVFISFAALFRFISLVSSPKCLLTSSFRSQKLLLNALCTPRLHIQGIINEFSPTSVQQIASVLWNTPLPITPGLVVCFTIIWWEDWWYFGFLIWEKMDIFVWGWAGHYVTYENLEFVWSCERVKGQRKASLHVLVVHQDMLHLLHWAHSRPRAWKRPSLFHHKPLCTKVLPVFLSFPWQKAFDWEKRKEEDPRRDRCFLRRLPDQRKVQNTSDL